MTGQEASTESWNSTDVQLNGQVVLVRTVKEMPTTQIVWLRLPSSAPDGQAYPSNDGQSLKKLYNKEIEMIDSTDGSATYTLEELKDVIRSILEKREPTDIRILDHKAKVADDEEKGCDHADHTISARLVAEVVEQHKLKGNVQGYASFPILWTCPCLWEIDMLVVLCGAWNPPWMSMIRG